MKSKQGGNAWKPISISIALFIVVLLSVLDHTFVGRHCGSLTIRHHNLLLDPSHTGTPGRGPPQSPLIGKQQAIDGNSDLDTTPPQTARQSTSPQQVPGEPSHLKQSTSHQHSNTLSLWQTLEDLPKNKTVLMSYTNGHYANLMINWALSCRRLGIPHFVAAIDDSAAEICQQHGIPYVMAEYGLGTESFRKDIGGKFRKMGGVKTRLAVELLLKHGWHSLAMTDTDVVWLRDPMELLDLHPEADLFISTDCLSAEAERLGLVNKPRCGHIRGSVYYLAVNSGIVIFRGNDAGVQVVKAWSQRLEEVKQVKFTDDSTNGTYILDDQLEWNVLLGEGSFPIQPASVTDKQLVYMWKQQVKVLPLPVLLGANGHTYFLQHLHQQAGLVPYFVHATFQRQELYGKVSRFREHGLWFVEPEDYYTTGNFLSYSNNVGDFITVMESHWKDTHHRAMTLLHKHFLAASYQLAVLQESLALAFTLNRTLVLPEFFCWCGQDFNGDVLNTCQTTGSDMALPFHCPADHMLDVQDIITKYDHMFRFSGFLQNPQVPPKVLNHVARVRFHFNASVAEEAQGLAIDHSLHLPLGSTDEEFRAALEAAGLLQQRLIKMEGAVPGMFSHWQRPEDAARFDQVFEDISNNMWCCSGGNWSTQWQYVHWDYDWPAPTAERRAGAPTWTPSSKVFTRPEFCDKHLTGDNVLFAQLPDHPCTYLNNTSVSMSHQLAAEAMAQFLSESPA